MKQLIRTTINKLFKSKLGIIITLCAMCSGITLSIFGNEKLDNSIDYYVLAYFTGALFIMLTGALSLYITEHLLNIKEFINYDEKLIIVIVTIGITCLMLLAVVHYIWR